jgi:hypothetical protein
MVAADTLPDTASGLGHFAFLHSVDGGHSWTVQHPILLHDNLAGINTIDQVDSLNVIASINAGAGNTSFALIVRTTDGGATWKEDSAPVHYITDISFSSPMNGILTGNAKTYITSDGGRDWDTIPAFKSFGWQCHAYGNGMYRVFESNYSSINNGPPTTTGEIYTTKDNWKTYDSIGPVISDPRVMSHVIYYQCSFGSGDTMFLSGYHQPTIGIETPYIARTIDGGLHWSSVYDDTTGHDGFISSLSDINQDTIVAGAYGYLNKVLRSTNKGATWEADSLICGDTNFIGYDNDGIGLNSEGDLIGAFEGPRILGQSGRYSLIIGHRVTSSVATVDLNSSKPQLYPNPATSSVTLTGVEAGRIVHLLDMLGREVLRSIVPADGSLRLDVSSLPPGIYIVSDGNAYTKFIKE